MSRKGIALVAVLALLSAASLLMLSYATLAAVNWMSVRNLREGLVAWSRLEAVASVAVRDLRTSYERHGTLPETYVFLHDAELAASVAYVRTSDGTGELELIAGFGKAAASRTIRLTMSPQP